MKLSTFAAFKSMKPQDDMVAIQGELLAQLQSVLLDMLEDIVKVCDANNITYYMAYGSFLGAVRHKGFIPWDDDLDICVLRKDYEKFRTAFCREHGADYWFHDPELTNGHALGFSRIRKKGTVLKCQDDFYNDEAGVFVDVFVLENVPDNFMLRKLHGLGSMTLGLCYSCRRFAFFEQPFLKMAENDEEITKLFKSKIALGKVLSFATVDSWTRLWVRWNKLCANDESKYVSVPAASRHYFGELVPRDWIIPVQKARFGDIVVSLPGKADTMLKRLYGDYLTLPPIDKRDVHNVFRISLPGKRNDE